MAGRFSAFETLDEVRRQPALYLGAHSVSHLQAFLQGARHLAWKHGISEDDRERFNAFHEWLASKYGWSPATAGWAAIVLKESGDDEAKALGLFFELLDEYRTRGG